MTEMIEAFGLKGGWSIDDRCTDPITGRTYDLRNKKDQNEVRRIVRRDRPLVLTSSPPCTAFSIANQGPIDPKELAGAIEMVKFAVEICDVQRREGRYFTFEQPQGSRAWDLEAVKEMAMKQGVQIPTMHRCMYGLWARDAEGAAMAYKPTMMVTNHEAVAEAVSRRCTGGHRHAHLVGKTACTKAAQHPKEMCEVVPNAVVVIKKDMEETQILGVEREDMCEDDTVGEEMVGEGYQDVFYDGLRDSVSGGNRNRDRYVLSATKSSST